MRNSFARISRHAKKYCLVFLFFSSWCVCLAVNWRLWASVTVLLNLKSSHDWRSNPFSCFHVCEYFSVDEKAKFNLLSSHRIRETEANKGININFHSNFSPFHVFKKLSFFWEMFFLLSLTFFHFLLGLFFSLRFPFQIVPPSSYIKKRQNVIVEFRV